MHGDFLTNSCWTVQRTEVLPICSLKAGIQLPRCLTDLRDGFYRNHKISGYHKQRQFSGTTRERPVSENFPLGKALNKVKLWTLFKDTFLLLQVWKFDRNIFSTSISLLGGLYSQSSCLNEWVSKRNHPQSGPFF